MANDVPGISSSNNITNSKQLIQDQMTDDQGAAIAGLF
jgi:hypothetical protein